MSNLRIDPVCGSPWLLRFCRRALRAESSAVSAIARTLFKRSRIAMDARPVLKSMVSEISDMSGFGRTPFPARGILPDK